MDNSNGSKSWFSRLKGFFIRKRKPISQKVETPEHGLSYDLNVVEEDQQVESNQENSMDLTEVDGALDEISLLPAVFTENPTESFDEQDNSGDPSTTEHTFETLASSFYLSSLDDDMEDIDLNIESLFRSESDDKNSVNDLLNMMKAMKLEDDVELSDKENCAPADTTFNKISNLTENKKPINFSAISDLKKINNNTKDAGNMPDIPRSPLAAKKNICAASMANRTAASPSPKMSKPTAFSTPIGASDRKSASLTTSLQAKSKSVKRTSLGKLPSKIPISVYRKFSATTPPMVDRKVDVQSSKNLNDTDLRDLKLSPLGHVGKSAVSTVLNKPKIIYEPKEVVNERTPRETVLKSDQSYMECAGKNLSDADQHKLSENTGTKPKSTSAY